MKKKHISTLSVAAKAATGLLLAGSIALLLASLYSLYKDVRFVTVCFFLLMAFGVYVAVRTVRVQLRVGVDFTVDGVAFHLDDDPVCISFEQIESVELLENGEALSPKKKVLKGGQMVFVLKAGGIRIVPLPPLRVKTAKRIWQRIVCGQKGGQ